MMRGEQCRLGTCQCLCHLCDCEEAAMPAWLRAECMCDCHLEVPQELVR